MTRLTLDRGVQRRPGARSTRGALALSLALCLAACGGGNDGIAVQGTQLGNDELPAPLYGRLESQLYDPVNNPTGSVLKRGSGAVSLQLESSSGTALPVSGDTSSVGTDAFWVDVTRDATLGVQLTDASLQMVSAVELYNANNVRVWRADASQKQASIQVQRGLLTQPWPRYQVRVIAATGATSPTLAWAWLGWPVNPGASAEDLRRMAQSRPANCAGCNLQGQFLGDQGLHGANLANANLRNAWLANTPRASMDPAAGALFQLFLDDSASQGVDLLGANLTGADLSGAVLSGAGRSGARLTGSNLTDATLEGVILDRAQMVGANMVRVKAQGSSFVMADLTGAQMLAADLRSTQFMNADLSSANLTDADLRGARLTGAQLTSTVLSGALLEGATWTDGRTCASGSIGTCD